MQIPTSPNQNFPSSKPANVAGTQPDPQDKDLPFKVFYQSCKWMAELKDIRGTQVCINVSGYKNYDGSLGYNLNDADCRWKNEING